MDKISLKLANDIQKATANLELAIAELRSLAVESVEVPYGPYLTLMIPPANDDDRVVIKSAGQGFTCVSYGSEGLIVDVYANDKDDNELLHTVAIDAEDLSHVEEHQPVLDPQKTVTVVISAHACSDYGDGPSAAAIAVNAEFLARLQSMQAVRKSSGHIDKLVLAESPDWLPNSVADELRLQCAEFVITEDNLWFADRPKHADYNIESNSTSFEELLEAFNGAADGDTVVIGDDDFKEHVAEMLETEEEPAHG